MSVKAETGKEVLGGLIAITLTLLFVLMAFLVHNVIWIVVGMLFSVGFALYEMEVHGAGFSSGPGTKS